MSNVKTKMVDKNMKNNKNIMVLNGTDIGISEIELKEADLLVIDKSGKYCLKICVAYN